MNFKIYNPYPDLHFFWIDWKLIEPFWRRNDFHPLDANSLKRAYHDLWFTKKNGDIFFITGGIFYDKNRKYISFINGRNRINLLSLYMSKIPISFDSTILNSSEVKDALIKPVRQTDTLTMPDLPILSHKEIKDLK